MTTTAFQNDQDGDGTAIDACDSDDDNDGIPDECDIDTTGGSDGEDDSTVKMIDPCQNDNTAFQDGDGTATPTVISCQNDDGDGEIDACDT